MKGQRRSPATRRTEADGLLAMYDWVVRTRAVLFDFLEGVPFDTLCREIPTLGHGSVRNLLLHVASSYRWWVEGFVKGLEMEALEGRDYRDCASVRREFAGLDRLIRAMVREQAGSLDQPISNPVPWEQRRFTATPRWLFTHGITHEFHHKGQIVTMARQLGHPPVETDLVPLRQRR